MEKFDLFEEGVTAEGVAALCPTLTTNTVLKVPQPNQSASLTVGVRWAGTTA